MPRAPARRSRRRRTARALGQQLTRDAHAIRAERDADGELTAPPDGADEHEIADVRAPDEQHHQHGAREHVQRRPHVADDLLRHRHQRDPAAVVRARYACCWRAARPSISACACSRVVPARSRPTTLRKCSARFADNSRIHGHRAPVRRLARRIAERSRHHADDAIRHLRADVNLASDDARIPLEVALPGVVTEHEHAVLSGNALRLA